MHAPSASLQAASCPSGSKPDNVALRILIVDNQPTAARSFERQLLCQNRFEIDAMKCVSHGLDALVVAEEFQPCLVVMEIGWPRRSGACTAKLLRSRPWAGRTVIVSHSREATPTAQPTADFDFHFYEGFSAELLLQIYPSLAQRHRAVPPPKMRAPWSAVPSGTALM